MKLFSQPIPLRAAIDKLESRDPVRSYMRTKEWADMPLAARDRAFFSAGVPYADFLDTAKGKLLDSLAMRKEAVAKGEAFVDRSSFIGDMRKLVLARGYGEGADPTDLQDLASRARLGLIYDMQVGFATGFARYQTDQSPDLLDTFPAQELLPSTARVPREDWNRRWIAAGGQVIDDRIVGLKTDPAWERLSIFGLPYPPFDFGSQRELMDIDREEAEALGLLSPGERLQPSVARLNDKLQASLRNLDPDTRETLASLFGDKIAFKGNTAIWTDSK